MGFGGGKYVERCFVSEQKPGCVTITVVGNILDSGPMQPNSWNWCPATTLGTLFRAWFDLWRLLPETVSPSSILLEAFTLCLLLFNKLYSPYLTSDYLLHEQHKLPLATSLGRPHIWSIISIYNCNHNFFPNHVFFNFDTEYLLSLKELISMISLGLVILLTYLYNKNIILIWIKLKSKKQMSLPRFKRCYSV